MRYTSENGKTYEKIDDQYYIVTRRKWLLYTTGTLVTILLILVIYDYIKDLMRKVSGYRDVMRGDGMLGMSKVYGFTRSNFVRGIILLLLTALIAVSVRFLEVKRPVEVEDVPEDILDN